MSDSAQKNYFVNFLCQFLEKRCSKQIFRTRQSERPINCDTVSFFWGGGLYYLIEALALWEILSHGWEDSEVSKKYCFCVSSLCFCPSQLERAARRCQFVPYWAPGKQTVSLVSKLKALSRSWCMNTTHKANTTKKKAQSAWKSESIWCHVCHENWRKNGGLEVSLFGRTTVYPFSHIFIGPKSDQCLACPSVPESVSESLAWLIFSQIVGFVKVVWICQSCYMDLSRLFYAFLALGQRKPSRSLTRISKLVEGSALN